MNKAIICTGLLLALGHLAPLSAAPKNTVTNVVTDGQKATSAELELVVQARVNADVGLQDKVDGIILIPGPVGNEGNQGEQGERGETGEIGWRGGKGPAGDDGDQGPKGDRGDAVSAPHIAKLKADILQLKRRLAGQDIDGDGYTPSAGDCDDAAIDVNPNQLDVTGDGIDNDCDGFADVPVDADGDGFYANSPSVTSLVKWANSDDFGFSTLPLLNDSLRDCNDQDANIFPGATEVYGNTIDENCNGFDDLFACDDIPNLGNTAVAFESYVKQTCLVGHGIDENQFCATWASASDELRSIYSRNFNTDLWDRHFIDSPPTGEGFNACARSRSADLASRYPYETFFCTGNSNPLDLYAWRSLVGITITEEVERIRSNSSCSTFNPPSPVMECRLRAVCNY